ncbi:hypothetical protein [Ulvibacterium marinum]|uniref:PorT family protein n=1 Tax=Ulvibacterium marinum TaxID=2419782 RepID=A0A3B0C6Y1_9FLAO|nr:hypothetical protein [Ulvibacterium marinum]RKN81642.1 hypothetical protein D7Z94_12105 [Ulvibacterium marinum]
MKNIILLMLIIILPLAGIEAQEAPQEEVIEVLRKQLDIVEEEEKKALKKQVENINSLLDNGVINKAEADKLKLKAAEERTKKIDERQAVLLKTIFFLENNEETPKGSKEVEIFLDVDSYAKEKEGLKLNLPKRKMVPESTSQVPLETLPASEKKEIRNSTTLDIVLALGLNNAVRDGITWQDIEDERDYLFYSSRFWEIGFALKTPLLKKNGLRLKYGVSYQRNELEPSGNRIFAEVDGQTVLQDFPSYLHKSSFVVHNLVLPIHLEFGPTKMKYNRKGGYYSTSNQFKIGIGGYVGISLDEEQRMEYPFLFRRRRFYRAETRGDYNVNQQIYGLSAYIGFGAFSLYGKYDLNTIFNNDSQDQQFVSVGFRLDL